jgi:2-polyprenyl-3-methyl-5-hydroxy-6-metoxy-1,4-benzoquinol methylase
MVILADINQSLPFRSKSFDVVVVGEVIEHTLFPCEILVECERIVKPGGLLLGSVPNGYHLRNRLRFLRGEE